jgi:acyl CoA:acetate/3-ketoacid CoA transferase
LTLEDHLEIKKKVKFTTILEHKLQFDDSIKSLDDKEALRYKIAKRAAKEIKSGMSVNLGVGIPTIVP